MPSHYGKRTKPFVNRVGPSRKKKRPGPSDAEMEAVFAGGTGKRFRIIKPSKGFLKMKLQKEARR